MSIMLQLASPSCFTFLFFFFLLVIIYWKRYFKAAQGRSVALKFPPGPWKLPLIGNIPQLIGSGSLPHYTLRDLAKKYGAVMHLKLGEVSVLLISSSEPAGEVLKNHELSFAQRPNTLLAEVMSYDQTGIISSPYGDYYKLIRKICVSELLSAKRVQSFRSIREDEVWNLIESISSSQAQGLPINLSKKLSAMTNSVTSRAAFGEKCKSQDEFISLAKEIVKLGSGFNVPDLFPSLKVLGFISGMKPALERYHQKIDKILEEIVDDHKMNMITSNDSPGNEDLVDVLLKLQESNDLKFEITTKHIKAITLEIYLAGGGTSASTIDWAMSELLKNPIVMNKAQAEVQQVLERKRKIEEADIKKLDYLKSVVKETLRLHPPAPFIIRESRERCEISGYDIPANIRVLINVWAIGRDPEHWINANCFQPERFHGSSVDFKGTDFGFLPFGAGRRMCPGISFGIANVELALAQLLYHFDWKLPNNIKPEELDMTEALGITSRRRNDLYLIATPFIPRLCET